ncbi:uncharacterized protein EI90DRAFT_1467123 [Cantharellus anzutake]|uniref:uncharacterized protein n=1 Tax=Cantharellus anzutake TaxID=1750568 RepID=UPI0019065A14|nr:uncharacterized protein EI90DRAFT_1467123 [Cantharellus anzutake]KAF8309610.1 hypothetical protein EI90DRAFT_1467123 [Cantharellus anzutake]
MSGTMVACSGDALVRHDWPSLRGVCLQWGFVFFLRGKARCGVAHRHPVGLHRIQMHFSTAPKALQSSAIQFEGNPHSNCSLVIWWLHKTSASNNDDRRSCPTPVSPTPKSPFTTDEIPRAFPKDESSRFPHLSQLRVHLKPFSLSHEQHSYPLHVSVVSAHEVEYAKPMCSKFNLGLVPPSSHQVLMWFRSRLVLTDSLRRPFLRHGDTGRRDRMKVCTPKTEKKTITYLLSPSTAHQERARRD